MSDYAIPYERNTKTKLTIFENGDQEHEDRCPGCNEMIMWKRETEEWEILDDGTEIPSLMTAWYCECDGCKAVFICPYDDGLVYYASGITDFGEQESEGE